MGPVPFCSENCGAGDTVPEFIRVEVPIVSSVFAQYRNGVLYQYALETPERCEWHRVSPGRIAWTVEILSRYPTGWQLIGGNPVPGKWTWRLSIDRLIPLQVHGWLKQFDRFVPPAEDPLHNCVNTHDVQTYVPLSTDPDANIRPVLTRPIGLDFQRHTTTCDCDADCPPRSRPPQKWFVQSDDIPWAGGYDLGKIYDPVDVTSDVCKWSAHQPNTGSAPEDLIRESVAPLNGADHAWRVRLIIGLPGGADVWETTPQWNDTGDIFEGYDALCDMTRILTTSTTAISATITPVPWYLCDDDGARAWVASHT